MYTCTQSDTVGDMHQVALQTTKTEEEEEEASCVTCQHLPQFRASMHQCRTHLCTIMSSLLLCMLFLTLETPATAI